MKKYLVHPGYVKYRPNNEDAPRVGFAGFLDLVWLYKVPKEECVDVRNAEQTAGLDLTKLIHLRPREDGVYTLPDENK
jgi:hypothetical protein